MIRAFLDSGWLVVTEFDDHPDFFQIMQDPEQLTFRGVHAVQTSTRALAAVLRQRNPEVAVFPNALVACRRCAISPIRAALTVFFGALNREQDWQPLMGAINAVARRAGERLRFSVVHDRGFFDALETPHKRFTAMCEYDAYMDLLGACEVSLMPLEDNGFNRAKSDLKFIEAGACRVAALASDVVYGETIEDGRTGLVFRDAAELQAKLMRLVAMPDTGARPGRRGARLRGAEPHAGLPDRAADRLVSLAVGAPRGADRGAARTAGGGARTGAVTPIICPAWGGAASRTGRDENFSPRAGCPRHAVLHCNRSQAWVSDRSPGHHRQRPPSR